MKVREITTPALRQAYEESGPGHGKPLLLVHGWPDSPRTWDGILPQLHAAGYRTIVPYLRGYGPSSFRERWLRRKPRRTGQPVAFAEDMIHLADRLGLERLDFVGHDWGARTGYALAVLFADRLKSLVTISVPFQPGKPQPPEFPQARAFWYQWLLCTIAGEKKLREDPVAFGRAQWDSWSPKGWYTEDDFEQAAKSWKGRDFVDVVLHGYRSRWGHAELDPAYQLLQQRFVSAKSIDVRTMLLHGMEDHCELLETTNGAEQHFSGGYRRVLLEEVGHFPQREYAEGTARHILDFLGAD